MALKRLDWDSTFFGIDIATIENFETLTAEQLKKFDLVTFKVMTSDFDIVSKLHEYNFVPVEGELLFRKTVSVKYVPQIDNNLAIATENEIDEVANLAMESYQHSRFKKPWFSEEHRNQFYAEWAKKAVLGTFDDICIIYKAEEAVTGFITLRKIKNKLVIGLIAVSENYRGQGIAAALLDRANNFALENNCDEIQVATQLSNISAANLYIKNDYLLSESSIWFYK
ncbi:GNAT family N-acetyltransferase [Pseudoalteromonas sp. BZB3]|uniref:GNAT family N-acetyltransferase n=1 Tax=Pseudoalteromonas sp. BZB3 TaxID=3136670 RepID=UPI0032C461B3